MRRTALAGVAVAFATSSATAQAGSGYVQVVEREYTLVLSRQSVKAGTVTVEALNLGMDSHNLALRKNAPAAATRRLPTLSHAAHASQPVRLTPGRYTLWCTLPGHRARGMVATLVVRR